MKKELIEKKAMLEVLSIVFERLDVIKDDLQSSIDWYNEQYTKALETDGNIDYWQASIDEYNSRLNSIEKIIKYVEKLI